MLRAKLTYLNQLLLVISHVTCIFDATGDVPYGHTAACCGILRHWIRCERNFTDGGNDTLAEV